MWFPYRWPLRPWKKSTNMLSPIAQINPQTRCQAPSSISSIISDADFAVLKSNANNESSSILSSVTHLPTFGTYLCRKELGLVYLQPDFIKKKLLIQGFHLQMLMNCKYNSITKKPFEKKISRKLIKRAPFRYDWNSGYMASSLFLDPADPYIDCQPIFWRNTNRFVRSFYIYTAIIDHSRLNCLSGCKLHGQS